MKKALTRAFCTFTAGLAIASAAQAEPFTLKYTATISSIQDTQQWPVPSYESASADGNVISLDDTVSGYFTFDTAIPPFFSAESWARYGSDEAISHVIVFDKTGYSQRATTYHSQIDVTNAAVGSGIPDDVTFDAPMFYTEGPGYVGQTTLTFTAPADTLDDLSIPVTLAPFTGWFTYAYVSLEDNQTLYFQGNITSASIVSSVPEPGTSAMLLGGLGFLAWRMRNAT